MRIFKGRYDDENDASQANTIADSDWRRLQGRARAADPERDRSGSSRSTQAAKDGAANYRNRWWN